MRTPRALNSHQLASFVITRILRAQGNSQFDVVRVKVWRRDGTVVFSDEPEGLVKRVAKYHQFWAVNAALASTIEAASGSLRR